MRDLIVLGIGVLLGGAGCAVSAKMFGWFNKQVSSAKADIGKVP